MSLRFQREDDVDCEVKEGRRRTPWIILFFIVLFAAVSGLGDWLSGQSLKSFGEEIVGAIGFGFVWWLVDPIYEEFRVRTKEIDGKVSAIESSMVESKERDTELLRRLKAIETRLDEIRDANRS
jgi:hypothetical protein